MKVRPVEKSDLSKALPVAETIAELRSRAEAAEARCKRLEDALRYVAVKAHYGEHTAGIIDNALLASKGETP